MGAGQPHPLSQRKTELVWEGKYDEYGNRGPIKLPASPLPLQRIETIDEPRDRSKAQGLLWKPESAHRDDFRNFLIWGDNKLALAGLSFRGIDITAKGLHWKYKVSKLEQLDSEGKIYWPQKEDGMPRLIVYENELPVMPLQDIWTDIRAIHNMSQQRIGFETQKPESLLERIIKSSSVEGSIIGDFFCGSGTTLAVAEKLGRRWIGVGLGRYATHVSRKRLIQVQRELHAAGKPYRSFDVYNLGRYERQWWQLERLKGADGEHRHIVLQFYKAAALEHPPNPLLHGKKHGAFVHVDQIDRIFAFPELRAAAGAAQAAGGRELHCLAWEFEMELAAKKQAIEAETGLTIRLKYIPREIIEHSRSECQFFEAGYLEAKTVTKGKKVDVALVHFTPALAEAPEVHRKLKA